MSMTRTIARNIARNHLIDAGYERPNKRLSMTAQGGAKHAQMVERTHRGRKNSRKRMDYIRKIRENDPQIWRRILYGDLAKKIEPIVRKANLRRGLAIQARKIHKEEAWQTIQKGVTEP